MADLDLMPPPMPGEQRQRKAGFFKKFFFKEDEQHAEAPEDVDLDEIKRKLGLDGHQETLDAHTEMQAEPDVELEAPHMDAPVERELPTEKVEIGDWTSEGAHDAAKHESSWDDEHLPQAPAAGTSWNEPAVGQEPAQDSEWSGAHHEAVEKHFAPIEKQHASIKESVEQGPEPSDWHLQDKEVPESQYFILKNGQPVKSLRELADAMEFIDETTFSHHMNEHRNDFANWVHAVVGKPDLAESIRKAESREQVADILKEHKQTASKKLAADVKQREKTVEKLETYDAKLDELRQKLQQKTQQLEEEKTASAKRMKQALDKELAARLTDERKAVAAQQREAERVQKDAEAALASIEDRTRELDAREAKVAEGEQQLTERLEQLKAQQAESKDLLKDAAKVKKDLASITKHKSQVQEHLASITKREKDLARKEESLTQRERKVTEDLTRMHEQQASFEGAKTEHDNREATVKAQEAAAAKLVAEAESRMQAAIEQEKRSVATLKAETKRLEGVRKKIDDALKQMLKNKQKAMYAAQLREHLELLIKETKEGVVEERKKLEDEGFSQYFDAKASAQPVGQPSSRDDDILRVKNLDIYKKVEEARAAVERKDLAAAKQLYNELRDDFQKQKLKMNQKNALYVSIRELYDDIHLAMLEQ